MPDKWFNPTCAAPFCRLSARRDCQSPRGGERTTTHPKTLDRRRKRWTGSCRFSVVNCPLSIAGFLRFHFAGFFDFRVVEEIFAALLGEGPQCHRGAVAGL